ncbi:MAG: NUDIX hydrolase [Phycisphaerae bacterium]
METLLSCAKFKVVSRDVRTRDGRTVRRAVIEHPGAVVILPLLDDGRIVLVRVFRHTLERELLELPAGTLDRPGEPPRDAAWRELAEETGYRADHLREIGALYPSPGVMTELIRAYLATGLHSAPAALEETEQIEVECVEPDQALAWIDNGEISDAKTALTLLRWDRAGRPSR